MKKLLQTICVFALTLVSPFTALAQLAGDPDADTGGDLGRLGATIDTLVSVINNTLIPFILALGFLAFVWGMFRYFIAGGANEEARESGRQLMIYAVLGFVLIVIFWGIVNLLAGSIGLEGQSLGNRPSAPTVKSP